MLSDCLFGEMGIMDRRACEVLSVTKNWARLSIKEHTQIIRPQGRGCKGRGREFWLP